MFFERLLKKDVTINASSYKNPEFIVNNWEKIIHSHPLKDYLRFLSPNVTEGDKLIFKTPYPIVKTRLMNSINEFEELLFKLLGEKNIL